MSMADFIEFDFPETKETIYLNRRYISSFMYDIEMDWTSVQIHGDKAPYNFPGDLTKEIKAAINRMD